MSENFDWSQMKVMFSQASEGDTFHRHLRGYLYRMHHRFRSHGRAPIKPLDIRPRDLPPPTLRAWHKTCGPTPFTRHQTWGTTPLPLDIRPGDLSPPLEIRPGPGTNLFPPPTGHLVGITADLFKLVHLRTYPPPPPRYWHSVVVTETCTVSN